MTKSMKAITIWQPWASLIACGVKIYETRSWATKYRGPIAIHAAAKPVLPWFQREVDKETRLKIIEAVGNPVLLPRGFVIATAEIVECWHITENNAKYATITARDRKSVKISYIPSLGNPCLNENELLFGDWTPGRYVWEIRNVKALHEPIAARGQQGLWNWNSETLSA